LEDQMIIQLFFERSEKAIESVSRKYENLCKSISYRIVRNEQDVEECLNDAYLAAWNTIPPQCPNPLSAYVCKLVRNISIKRYRRNTATKRNTYYDMALDEISECLIGRERTEESLDEKEITECINRFLDTLEQIDRVIFVKRYWFCNEIKEIANEVGESSNYVNVHLHRVKTKLRNHMITEGYL